MIHDAQVDYYGNHLATCSSDRSIKIWKLGDESKDLSEIAVIRGHEGPVWQVAWLHPRFAASGMQILASCGFDGKVCLWQQKPSNQWEVLFQYRHTASVNSVSAAPHDLGCHVLSASADGSISMASLDDQNSSFSVETIEGAHLIGVNAVSWAPSLAPGDLASSSPPTSFQKRFVSAGCDNLVKVWTVQGSSSSQWVQQILDGEAKHKDWVRDVAWAPAAGLLVSLYFTHSNTLFA
jgi:protein transport protein SEC13